MHHSPRESDQRRGAMTNHSLLTRFKAGDTEEVWEELRRLGPAVRQPPHFEPAMLVCQEMMTRCRHNLTLLFRRLYGLGYEFLSMRTGQLFRLTERMANHPWESSANWQLPAPNTAAILQAAEQEGTPVPLVVRVWMETIGYVSLIGRHPILCPCYTEWKHPAVYADPFVVEPSPQEVGGVYHDEPGNFLISPADREKSEVLLDGGVDYTYALDLPGASVDAKMRGPWYDATFVQYVRKNFEWGGFPGWERYPERPEKELAFLREGLLPI